MFYELLHQTNMWYFEYLVIFTCFLLICNFIFSLNWLALFFIMSLLTYSLQYDLFLNSKWSAAIASKYFHFFSENVSHENCILLIGDYYSTQKSVIWHELSQSILYSDWHLISKYIYIGHFPDRFRAKASLEKERSVKIDKKPIQMVPFSSI